MVGYRVKRGGTWIEVDTVEEVQELLLAIEQIDQGGASVVREHSNPMASVRGQLIRALEIAASAPDGVPSAALASALHLDTAQSLARAAVEWRALLAEHDLNLEDVLQRRRKSRVYLWRPGPRIGDAQGVLAAAGSKLP